MEPERPLDNASSNSPVRERHWRDLVRLHASYKYAPDGRLQTDVRGIIRDANRVAEGFFERRREFPVDKPLGLFFSGLARSEFYRRLSPIWRGVPRGTFEVRRNGGSEARFLRVVVVADFDLAHLKINRESVVRQWRFTDLTQRKQSEALSKDLLRRHVDSQETERQRVSRELHDSAGQLVTTFKITVERIRTANSRGTDSSDLFRDLEKIADDLERSIHDVAHLLRPSILDDAGLAAALIQLLHEWLERPGLTTEFEGEPVHPLLLPPEIETACYRIVQEALRTWRAARAPPGLASSSDGTRNGQRWPSKITASASIRKRRMLRAAWGGSECVNERTRRAAASTSNPRPATARPSSPSSRWPKVHRRNLRPRLLSPVDHTNAKESHE